jgi:leucyl aminopeptidase
MFQSVKIVPAVKAKPAVLVIGHFKSDAERGSDAVGGAPLDKLTKKLDRDGSIAKALRRTEATGDLGRVIEVFPSKRGSGPGRILVVGLGKKDKFEPGCMREVAAAVGRRLTVTKDESIAVDFTGAIAAAGKGADAARFGQCFGEGLGLLSWHADQFKGKGQKEPPKRLPLSASAADDAFSLGMKRGLALAMSANLTRTLSETPPNIATPEYIAAGAQSMATDLGLLFKVFKGKQLEDERFAGLINVGKASENKPCMIRLEYVPKGGPGKSASRGADKPVVLIGKTMTYDSGGLSLKINNGMVGMKRDKDGGCAVLGAMHAIASVVRPNRRVVALLAVAENSISDEAYRPDDILTYRNGVTVEITNTDAEGRLVLADALCWACEKENPACIIDLATLTGGVVVALGSTYCGMFCEDDALRADLEAASKLSGERLWRLPMHQEYRDLMKSPVADILNSNPNRKAHPIQGAAFLSYFVDEKIPWCHLDIAGVHATESDQGPFVKSSNTGWGVRLLAEMLAAM